MNSTITKGMILNISSNADVFARGEKYFREGKILSNQFLNDPNGQTIIKAMVEGNYKNYSVTLRIGVSGSLKHYSCDCESHNIWRGACKHVVATLFICEQELTRNPLPGQMYQQARNLTDALEKCIFHEIDNRFNTARFTGTDKINLIPVLHANGKNDIYLTFRLGYERFYKIKNISEFTAAVKCGSTLSYGNKIEFVHTVEAFSVDSQPLLDFIMREESLFTGIIKQLGKQNSFVKFNQYDTRSLPLTEQSMDAFFDLYNGSDVQAETGGYTHIRFETGLPDLSLRLMHGETKTRLAVPPFNHQMIKGQQFHYLLTHDYLYRMSKCDADIISQLGKTAAYTAKAEIIFTGTEQQRFLSVILPRLCKMGIVNALNEKTPVCVIPAMKTQYYFDTEGADVVGRVEFIYDKSGEIRDFMGEYTVKQQLTAFGFFYDEEKNQYRMKNHDAIYDFLHHSVNALREQSEVFVTDNLLNKSIQTKTPSMGLRLEGDLLTINIDNAGYTINELMEALESYRAKKKYHRLKDGRFLTIDENVSPAAELLDALQKPSVDKKAHSLTVPAYHALFVNEILKEANVVRNEHFQQLIDDFTNPPAFKVPLPGILREYQKTGFNWLKSLAHYSFGGILADDMGLGKTLQIIALLVSEQKADARSLIVVPTSVLYNWENEFKRFAPEITTLVVVGLPDKREALLKDLQASVVITTYDTMKRDIAAYEHLFFEYIIADEAQYIKNAVTQNAKAIKEIKGRVKFALTGTPIENNLSELWSIFDFIIPGYLYSHHRFTRLYESPIMKDNNKKQESRLKRQIDPFILRRMKKSVLTELPDKTETMLQADMNSEQKKIYHAHLLIARGELEEIASQNKFNDNRIQILAQLTRLRQICCHPSLFLEGYKNGSGKLALALETIQMAVESGHRILLFSQFTAMLDIIKKALSETPYAYFYLDGATKSQTRMEMTRRFNEGERDLFLISLKAGGTGLNLTGADVVIHYDQWWNPSVMDQASDRAHRYGQEKSVQVFNLVAKDSIEEKIMELQNKKRYLIDSVISESGSMINALTEEEIRGLFMVD